MIYWNYLKYVLRHKWFVMLACFKVGLYWRGIVHDMSKFLPDEFFAYAQYYYGEKTWWTKQNLDLAWLKHQRRNKHHWQWWIQYSISDEGDWNIKVFEMPERYLKEMVCDWRGAGMSIKGNDDSVEFFKKNDIKILLYSDTRKKVIEELGIKELPGYRRREKGMSECP